MEPTANEHPDVQIVGAGLAGLLAANLAADAGLTVRLLERTNAPGGRATTVDHHGYQLNVGPHALYVGGELHRHLVALGLDPDGAIPATDRTTGSIAGRIGAIPAGPGSLLRTGLIGPRAKFDLGRLLARIPRLTASEFGSTTVDEWIGRATADPDLRHLLRGLVTVATYNAAADRASVDAAIGQLQMLLDGGVRYLDGGWGSVVSRLAARLDRPGVTRVSASASTIEIGADGPVIVTTDGERLGGRACVVTAGGPIVADRLLGVGPRFTDDAGPAVEASVLDLGLRATPDVGAHFALDERLYGSLHSIAAGTAPAGHALVTLARYRLPGEDTDPPTTRAALEGHAEAMGIERADIDRERYLHRLTVTGGMPLAERGGLGGRPPVVVPDRPGVFLAGDWVGSRGLLADASAASAAEAIDHVRELVRSRASVSEPGRARLVGS